MKKIILIAAITVVHASLCAQSKKEQIATLTKQIDSLKSLNESRHDVIIYQLKDSIETIVLCYHLCAERQNG